MTDSHPKASRPSNPVLETLSATFPVFRDGQPLAIGIHKAIKARLPNIGEGSLRMALKGYTASTKYLKVIANGKQRFDLDGNPAGEVTPEQRQQALETIKERFRKAAERKKDEQEAKERQEKLQKLAEKFNQR
jgi:ProP effector